MTDAKVLNVSLDVDLRRDAEAVLDDGESLSDFVATCVRSGISWRRAQDAFLKRSQDAVARACRDGTGITPQVMLARLDARLEEAQSRLIPVVPPSQQS